MSDNPDRPITQGQEKRQRGIANLSAEQNHAGLTLDEGAALVAQQQRLRAERDMRNGQVGSTTDTGATKIGGGAIIF